MAKINVIEHVTTMTALGEAVVALVRESGVLKRKPGRKKLAKRGKRKPKSEAAAERPTSKRKAKADSKAAKERMRREAKKAADPDDEGDDEE